MRRYRPQFIRLLTPIAALLFIATPLAAQHLTAAQRPIAGPRASDVWVPSANPAARLASATAIPDTIRSRPTHWREGALVGGIAGVVAGAWLVGRLCALSEEGGQNCTGAAVGGAAVLGACGGTLGSLIGGLFPKRPAPPQTESGTAP